MRPLVTLSFLLALAAGAPLVAQYVQPLPQTMPPGDADALADQVRALAANPSDLNALVRAGELALKLEDPTAAASFFARAERIDPRSGRVKAGLGQLLVQSERPGEALRRFAEAESYGARPASFAADRGLAYDLIGEQERAQRDYRLALKAGANDETTRRYALSLGISGKREEALALLDPLLRKSDRGAWRARAFILAMSGNRVDAEQIATTMMPAGMSQGLQPFFDRLPTLSPVDRAFAVHFGETRPSAQRYADARMVPPLPPLGVDPDARELALAAQAREKPVRVAEAQAAKPAKRKRGKREPIEVAVQSAAPPVALALPTPPAYVDPSAAARSVPGQTTYYVQRLPSARTYAPAPPPSYGAVAQANRAAAAAAAPVMAAPVQQPQASTSYPPVRQQPAYPSYQPVQQQQTYPSYQQGQRVSGRVMPLAPLQPVPLPSAVPVAQTRTPAWYGTPGKTVAQPVMPVTPPAETATRVERQVPATTAVPVTPAATAPVPVETATRVERTPATVAAVSPAPATTSTAIQPYTAAVAPSSFPTAAAAPVMPAPVQAASAAPAQMATSAVTPTRSEDVIVPREIPTSTAAPAEPQERMTYSAEPVRPAPIAPAARTPARSLAEARRKAVSGDDAKPEPKIVTDRKATGGKGATTRNDEADAAPEIKKAGSKRLADKKDVAAKHAAESESDAAESGKKPVGRKAGAKKTVEADEPADTKSAGGKTRGDKKAGTSRKSGDAEDDADTRMSTGSKRGDRRTAAGKKAAAEDDADTTPSDGKKRADKKGADSKKTVGAKRKDAKEDEPSRVWVQVSGGANEGDLPKQWNKLRTDKPGMFKNRQGYATPLRATNRILTGPFANEAEAQAYVNKLAKQGVSGFLFKSEPGQKVSKLPTK